jgi:hypothetical protein
MALFFAGVGVGVVAIVATYAVWAYELWRRHT